MKKVLTSVEIVVAVALLSLIGSFIIPYLFELRLTRNEQVAEVALKKIIAPALENYAKDNNGRYPVSESDLLEKNPPYLNHPYDGKILQGYVYTFNLSNSGYTVEARPYKCGATGSGRKIFTITTASIYTETDCNGNTTNK